MPSLTVHVSMWGQLNLYQAVLFSYLWQSPTLLEHRLENVSCQARIFFQSADGVSVPIAPKWNVHAQMMAGRMDDIAELFVYTKEHLELVSAFGKLQITNDPQCLPNHQFVMCRDSDVRTIS